MVSRAGLVDIVRDFLEAHQLMRRLFASFRGGDLGFEELGDLVSDDEYSVLFRLKERCHALFRPGGPGSGAVTDREALFDLAVGSLFHEAMKFRENYYQREVYGPRMRELRTRASGESAALFREFERILAAGEARLDEGLKESEILLERTREQLRLLLAERGDGQVARFLIENVALVEQVFDADLSSLLADIHGSAEEGYAVAGRSYLASGYFEAAERTFRSAVARGGERGALERLSAYAAGMSAYLRGDYAAAADQLGTWVDAGASDDRELVSLARAAVSRIGQLVSGSDRERVVAAAAALLERLPEVSDARTHLMNPDRARSPNSARDQGAKSQP